MRASLRATEAAASTCWFALSRGARGHAGARMRSLSPSLAAASRARQAEKSAAGSATSQRRPSRDCKSAIPHGGGGHTGAESTVTLPRATMYYNVPAQVTRQKSNKVVDNLCGGAREGRRRVDVKPRALAFRAERVATFAGNERRIWSTRTLHRQAEVASLLRPSSKASFFRHDHVRVEMPQMRFCAAHAAGRGLLPASIQPRRLHPGRRRTTRREMTSSVADAGRPRREVVARRPPAAGSLLFLGALAGSLLRVPRSIPVIALALLSLNTESFGSQGSESAIAGRPHAQGHLRHGRRRSARRSRHTLRCATISPT